MSTRLPRSIVRFDRLRIILVMSAIAVGFTAPEAYAQKRAAQNVNVIPITISSVNVEAGQLVAHGLVGSNPFTAPLTITAEPQVAQATCPVLHLQLGPIHLGLLGLNVDTSAICLDITAHQGQGLLGNLLCSIGNLLNQGTPLSTILTQLTAADLSRLDRGLTSLLNQAVFIPLTSASAVTQASCSILHLELGPLDLTLLGLEVQLDDCNGGPVTLDITATPGGGLLGDLLCNLANLLNNPQPNLAQVLNLLRQIAAVIGGLVG